MSVGSTSSAGSSQSHAHPQPSTVSTASQPTPIPGGASPASVPSPRLPHFQFSGASSPTSAISAPPAIATHTSSSRAGFNASNSLVGQLLSASGHSGAGATGPIPYGMIVSAGGGSTRPPALERSSQDSIEKAATAAQVTAKENEDAADRQPTIQKNVGSEHINSTGVRIKGGSSKSSVSKTPSMPRPDIKIPEVPGYTNLRPIYAINHIQLYRARSVMTNKPVVLKLCTVNHLDTLARLRFEWKMFSDIATPNSRTSIRSTSSQSVSGSVDGYMGDISNSVHNVTSAIGKLVEMVTITRPFGWDYLPDGGMTLIYEDEPQHLTVHEAFLPGIEPHIPGTTPPTSDFRSTPIPKPRTQSDLIKILTVFSNVVNVLAVAHQAGITHNNINTFSILVVNSTGSASSSSSTSSATIQGKLGGWHLASRLEREELGRVAGGAMLRGENPAPLQYIAPECTGRMNRSVDYRADFYSLGIALYELIVGFLPFRSAEPLELIHMHIAQASKTPTDVNASIPRAISDIVMKLLSKSAEDRYQTAAGLKADLDLAIRLLSEGKPLDELQVGRLDTTSQFVITEKLYGREEAVAALREAYDSCLQTGGCTMVTIQGPSGIGKSRLVNEIQRPVVEKKGFFTSGKFEQHKRSLSFFTLVHTLQDLIRQVLSESHAALARWRTDVIRAFDAYGDAAVLVDVIPELKLLLGVDFNMEPLADLGPSERESRFRDAFGRLLAVFGRKGVVIFLDDLQWCSHSEFMLIANVAEEANRRAREWEVFGTGAVSSSGSSVAPEMPECNTTEGPPPKGILIIGAYRDSEVTVDHPIFSMIEYLRQLSVRVVDIHLTALSADSVRRIIGDTLHRDPESSRMRSDPEMQTLTELVYAKTAGNPFFVIQLLKSLHRAGHIVFEFSPPPTASTSAASSTPDAITGGGGGQWRFNLTSIEAADLPPTVVDLLVKQMLKLSEATRTVMMLASCLGSDRISLHILATAAGKRIQETANDLWGALDGGLVLLTGGNYKIHMAGLPPTATLSRAQEHGDSDGDGGDEEGEEEVTYRFLHDRVRQAAYSLIPPEERAGVHRMIGMRMLASATPAALSNGGLLYEIVNQLNHWLSPLDAVERRNLMELNLKAGKRALAATAFSSALTYFQVAKRALDAADTDGGGATALAKKRFSFGLPAYVPCVGSMAGGGDAGLDALGTEINMCLMEAYFADVKYTSSIQLAEQILPQCTGAADKVRCLINKMNCLLVQGRLNEAIESGLAGLSVLSWEVPLDDAEAVKHAAMIKPRILLSVAEIRALAKLPELKDENLLLLQEIVSTLILPVYMARPALLPAVCFTSVAITLQFGVSLAGTYPILMTGVILGADAAPENMARSYAFGRLAIALLEREPRMPALAPAIYEVYAGHIGVFHQPMSEVLQYLQRGVTAGLAVFNVDYTIFAMAELCAFGMLAGESLSAVHAKMLATKPNILRFRQESGLWWLSLPLQFCMNLRGVGNADPLCFEGAELGTAADLTRLATGESMSHIYVYHMYRLMVSALYGFWDLTADLATHACEPLLVAMTSTFYGALTAFYATVALFELHATLSELQRGMIARNMAHLRVFAAGKAKGIWLHKLIALEAEELRATSGGGQQLAVLDLYDRAVALALASGFVHDAAFINERAGVWLLALSPRRAAPYLREAHRCYSVWGATHKAGELRRQYPDELAPAQGGEGRRGSQCIGAFAGDARPAAPWRMESEMTSASAKEAYDGGGGGAASSIHELFAADAHDDEAASHSSSARANDSSSLGSELDFRTVLKASLVISEGIHLEDVIVSLMTSVLQTAGADYGVLILAEDGVLHVETVGLLNQVSILEHEPLHARPDLVPVSVVNIVASLGTQILRNGDDAKFELTYGRDAYFRARHAKSVLCMPIQNQLKTMGVLYLENRLVNHAFTQQRQELLNLLCTQAAVTIDKARLYRQMELAKRAAEEATAEKSTFLANMSHEIRTPFNALLSCSIFLNDTALSEQQREYVETIRQSALLTLQIIDGILDFSKIEHGAIDLQTTPFSLRDCVESAMQLVAEPAATKDLELAYRNECSNVDLVCGDITRFRQCIINMIGNAVKFTQEGHILVTTRATPPEGEGADPATGKWTIQVSVKDTGIGIPENAFSRLFRAFSQVDTSTRRTYGGTGLGLAISKKLAQMMGGDIWFESTEGAGTTFHFTIAASVVTRTWSADPRLAGKHALVADTHRISSNILADELEVEGLAMTRCASAAAALAALTAPDAPPFAVALLDLSVMDPAYALLAAVQRAKPALKVILMSRFGATIPAAVLASCALSFVRPAPRARYVEAVLDALHPPPPRRPASPGAKSPGHMQTLATRHPLRILLAEDNPVNTRVALQHLKRMGYTDVAHAKDGIECLELCEAAAAAEEGMYDVVLMDIQMPRCDGLTASRELARRYGEGERPTLVALTANATAGDRERCHDAGMGSHIAKPILPNDLAAALIGVRPLRRRGR
ncbi:hypothetical protein EDC01DRAFT_779090 [Geopyxis carbonaria]|nr:hypothetical protein EDC01DRAFT_779090 [Geopyxis carbonaria]